MSGRISGLYICVPDGGHHLSSATSMSISSLENAFAWKYKVPSLLMCRNCSDLEELRNYLISEYYYKYDKFSHMLFVDNDMGFDWRMVNDMVAFDKPVTGTFYSQRGLPPKVVGNPVKADHTADDVVDGHIEARRVGGGVLLIRRTAISEMIDKHPEWRTVPKGLFKERLEKEEIPYLLRLFDKVRWATGGGLSEDFSFCHRWREMCGGEIWANVNYPVSHVGLFEYKIRYMDYLDKEKVEQMPYWERMDVGGDEPSDVSAA